MLLHDLIIENYRSFAKYKLNNLARVNLLVGDNNCGKTSVLEAVSLLATDGDMGALLRTLRLREDIESQQIPGGDSSRTAYDGRSLFHFGDSAQDYGDLAPIQVRSTSPVSQTVEVRVVSPTTSKPADLITNVNGSLAASIQMDGRGRIAGPWFGGIRWLTDSGDDVSRFAFIPAGGLSAWNLGGLWQGILLGKKEGIVVEAMQVLHPLIDGVIFSPATEHRHDIFLSINSERESLAKYGGGSICLLSIAIAFASIRSGHLLIDEIDTGLHYSRLQDMWRMVIKTAAELDVQVFATTHSLDCIRALAGACNVDESLREHVALFSIDRRMDEAVRYGADELAVVVDHEIEVR